VSRLRPDEERPSLRQRLLRARSGLSTLRARMAEDIQRAREPVELLYVRCDGCQDVTSHMATQRILTITRTSTGASPEEIVCDLCRHAQPRSVGDEVPSDTQIDCAGFRHRQWRAGRSRRPCARTFWAPSSAHQPRCQWCLSIQPAPPS
jgi:hypothetical protein